jgi:beta-glucosidase
VPIRHSFQLGCPTAQKDAVIPVSIDIINDTATPGEEVVFVFAAFPDTTARRSRKELKAFRKVAVGANATTSFTIPLRVQDLNYWEGGADGRWVVESGKVQIMVGKSAADAELTLRQVVEVL